MTEKAETDWKCGKHGFYKPDFERVFDEEICPRIMCLECEEESMRENAEKRPKNVPYFYKGNLKVVLEEAHKLSAVWAFSPPVVYPQFTFAEDLSPIVPEDALTSEEIMARMKEMLPQMEEMVAAKNIKTEELVMIPGKDFTVEE